MYAHWNMPPVRPPLCRGAGQQVGAGRDLEPVNGHHRGRNPGYRHRPPAGQCARGGAALYLHGAPLPPGGGEENK